MHKSYKLVDSIHIDDILASHAKYSKKDFTHNGIEFVWIDPDTTYKISEHFTNLEFLTKCPKKEGHYIDKRLIMAAQFIRYNYGATKITSTFRNGQCNHQAGGVPLSYHQLSMGIDLRVYNRSMQDELIKDIDNEGCLFLYLKYLGIGGIGIYESHLHIDTGKNRLWDSRGNFSIYCCE